MKHKPFLQCGLQEDHPVLCLTRPSDGVYISPDIFVSNLLDILTHFARET